MSGGGDWAAPSRRVRAVAAAIAVLLPALIFAVVSFAWRRPVPPSRPVLVEVKIVESPPVAAQSPRSSR